MDEEMNSNTRSPCGDDNKVKRQLPEVHLMEDSDSDQDADGDVEQQQRNTSIKLEIINCRLGTMNPAQSEEKNTRIEKGLQQLKEVLRKRNSSKRQIQVFKIFSSNPPLVDAFSNHKKGEHMSESPNTHEYDSQISDLLRSSPSLFDIYRKQRTYEVGAGYQALFAKIKRGFYLKDTDDEYRLVTNQCQKCEYFINERYHCTVCENYDLCPTCKEEIGHPHKMVKLLDEPPQRVIEASAQGLGNENSMGERSNQGFDTNASNCSKCRNHAETGYYCTVCNNYGLCVRCKKKYGHHHSMQKFGLDMYSGSTSAQPAVVTQIKSGIQRGRHFSVQKYVDALVHACECENENCTTASCQRMKQAVEHIKTCTTRMSGGCQTCKQIIAYCCSHPKNCRETQCSVPFCFEIKQKLREQRLQSLRRSAAAPIMRPTELGSTSSSSFALPDSLEKSGPSMASSNSDQQFRDRLHEMFRQIKEKSSKRSASVRKDLNQSASFSLVQQSRPTLGIQRCISFKKKGYLARSQKQNLTVLAKNLSDGTVKSFTTDCDVDTNAQTSVPENSDVEMKTLEEDSRLAKFKKILETLNKNVSQLADVDPSLSTEFKRMIQNMNEKVDDTFLPKERKDM